MANKKLEGVPYTAELRSISKRVLALKHTDSKAAEHVKSHLSSDTLPLSSVRAMRTIILQRCNESDETKSALLADLNAALSKVADDETMKSMTYATSVGMNMIVAPISFGAFMYFFSGQLFGRVLDKDGDGQSSRHINNNVDIRAVIAGVISGVIMLFIEMTLFVIRSHEMDAAVTKKAKKRQVNPFGYDKRTAARTFEG